MILVWLLSPLAFVLNWLSRSALLSLGTAIGGVWFHVIRFRRQVVLQNLELVYGHEKSKKEIASIARDNFSHYCQTLLEVIASVTWSENDFRKNVAVEGVENLTHLIRAKKGAFLLTSHLGNWEFAICAAAAHGIPVDIVVKRSPSGIAEAFQRWYRLRTGADLHAEEGSVKGFLRALSRGRFVAFVLDQFMGPPIGLPVRFFGRPAGTAVGLALITDRREEPIIPVYSYRDSKGLLHTVFCEPIDFGELASTKEERLFQKTQLFNDVIESQIRRHPAQWLWLHRRWKEYRGEARWKLTSSSVSALTAMAIVMMLVSCASPPGATPTGIPLPPDPSISVPTFQPPPAETPVTDAKGPEKIEVEGVTAATKPSVLKRKKVKLETKVEPPKQIFAALPSHQIPFEVGERLEMDLHWMALPAGTAILEVREGPRFAGRPTFQLWGNVLSSRIVDTVYHVDNTIESFIDAQGLIPYKFLLHMVESAQNKETRVSFDHTEKKAFYWAKRISQKWGNQDIDRTDSFTPESRDMFSAFFYARAINYVLNQKQVFNVYENGQTLEIELLPVANELVVSKVGAFQCWKVMVTIKLDNVLKPTGDMVLWFSDDLKRYPVKFDAKLKIGSLYGNLSKIRERQ